MTRPIRILLPGMILVAAAGGLAAAELIPLPDFTSFEVPDTQRTAEPSAKWDYVDLGVLTAALALASYLALVRRSRGGLLLLTIGSLAWLGFWREGCVCPIGAIQNVTLAVFDGSYLVPAVVVALFALPLVFTLFFGRTFCAAVCPLGAVQELVAIRPVRVPAWVDHSLGLLGYVYLGLAVLFAATGSAFVICRYDPFVGLFRRSAGINMLVLGGCFLVIGLFVGRPYCRYLCPYGALLGLLSKASKWHLKIPPEACVQCRLCEDMCPYGAIREPTVVQPAAERLTGRRRLAGMLVLLPALVALGAWLGTWLERPFARVDPEVRLAEQIVLQQHLQQEVEARLTRSQLTGSQLTGSQLTGDEARRQVLQQHGWLEPTTDAVNAVEAFRDGDRSVEELHAAAARVRREFRIGGGIFGAWVGLVIGVKLIHLCVRRRRVDYQPDKTSCVSCGRCFWYCPHEQARLGLIREVTATSVTSKTSRTSETAKVATLPAEQISPGDPEP